MDILASVLIGHLIDRKNNTILNFTAYILTAAGFSLFLFGFSVYAVYAVAAITSFSTTLIADSFSAIIKKHVSETGISKATSYQQGFTSVSTLIGFAVCGLSLVFISEYAPYLLVSITAVEVVLSFSGAEQTSMPSAEKQGQAGYRNVFSFFRKLIGFLLLGLVLNGFIVTLDVYGSGLFNLYLHTGPLRYAVFVASLPQVC